MKKLLMTSVVALSSVFAVTACTSVGATTDTTASTSMQKNYKSGMKQGSMSGPFSQLNLSATQKAQMQAIRQNSRNERGQTREAMEAVLTAEQRTQLATMRAQRQSRGHQGMNNKGGMHKRGSNNMGMQSPLSQLNLTATQQAQIEAIHKDPNSNRLQRQKAVMAVLTPEQRTQLEALKSQRQGKRYNQAQ